MSSNMTEEDFQRFEPYYSRIYNPSELTDFVGKLTGNLQVIFNKHTTLSFVTDALNGEDTSVSVKGPTSYLFSLPSKGDRVSFSIAGDDPPTAPSGFECTVEAIGEPKDGIVYQIQINPNAKTVGTDVKGVMDLTCTQSTD